MYILGLDYGGTQIKAALYDQNGRECHCCAMGSEAHTPQPRIVEKDMAQLWHSFCRCVQNLLAQSGVRGADIVALAASSHGKGLYLLDREGQPCGRGILSADTRALPLVQRWRKDGLSARLYATILQDPWPAHPLALLAYLRKTHDERLAHSAHILMGHDYLRYCLTGNIAAERSNMSGSGLVAVREGAYALDVLGQLGLEELVPQLPPLLDSSELAGRVTAAAAQATGLLAGTPVYGGFFDVVGAAVASGLQSEDDLHAIMGTWSISTRLSFAPPLAAEPSMPGKKEEAELPRLPWASYALPGSYFVHDGSASSAGNLDWFLERFAVNRAAQDYEQNDRIIAAKAPAKDDLFFYPYLYAANIGPENSEMPGCLVGLRGNHDYEDVLCAVYEGILFAHKVHIDKLYRIRQSPKNWAARRLLLTGGPSRSKVWMQKFADLVGLPLIRLAETRESGCKGAAMAAAVGAGWFANFQEAMACWVRYEEALVPEHSALWAEKYQRYVGLGKHIAAGFPAGG